MAHNNSLAESPYWYGRFTSRRKTHRAASNQERPCGNEPLMLWDQARSCHFARFGAGGHSLALFEGDLFDIRQWRAEFHLPPTATAIDVVIRGYERWHAALFDHLDGVYLLAVWDAFNGKFLLGHDALGEHPVYFAQSGGELYFSSNILALAQSGTVSTAANRLTLALSLLDRHYWPPAGETFFSEIKRLHPGHFLAVDVNGASRMHCYWTPWHQDTLDIHSQDQNSEEFEARLTRAVQRRMELGPNGILLSGGIDSVTIAGIAARELQQQRANPLVACSARAQSGHSPSNEEAIQDLVAARLSLPQLIFNQEKHLLPDALLSNAIKQTPLLPAPTNVWWLASYLGFYRYVAAHGVNVALTGSGGDEWLGVHPAHTADLLCHGEFVRLYQFLHAEKHTGGLSNAQISRHLLWRNGIRLPLCALWQRWSPTHKQHFHRRRLQASLPSWLCPDDELKAELQAYLLSARIPDLDSRGRIPESYYQHTLTYLWCNALMTHELEFSHHIQGTLGLRLLNPFHDRRLVEFFAQLPPHLLYRGKRYKGLLRPLAQRLFPAFNLENQRKISDGSSMSYIGSGLSKGLNDLVIQRLSGRLEQLGIVHIKRFETTLEHRQSFNVAQKAMIFATFMADSWLQCHSSNRGYAAVRQPKSIIAQSTGGVRLDG